MNLKILNIEEFDYRTEVEQEDHSNCNVRKIHSWKQTNLTEVLLFTAILNAGNRIEADREGLVITGANQTHATSTCVDFVVLKGTNFIGINIETPQQFEHISQVRKIKDGFQIPRNELVLLLPNQKTQPTKKTSRKKTRISQVRIKKIISNIVKRFNHLSWILNYVPLPFQPSLILIGIIFSMILLGTIWMDTDCFYPFSRSKTDTI